MNSVERIFLALQFTLWHGCTCSSSLLLRLRVPELLEADMILLMPSGTAITEKGSHSRLLRIPVPV